LTESLAAPLLESTRKQYEQKMALKENDIARREALVRAERESISQQVNDKLLEERERIAAEEAKKAQLQFAFALSEKSRELTDVQEALKEREAKLVEAHKAQIELLRKQRELDDFKREMELTIETRVQASLTSLREQAKKEAEDSLQLKVKEKDLLIASMQQKIDELRRRSEQGSQQLQGEAQEVMLETMLRDRFPMDALEPVAKGESGADVLQRVTAPGGQPCGAILWESKRTKNWSDGWLPKLRDDQRAAKADIAIIVSRVLPKEVPTFDLIDGVWVCSPQSALSVATALRYSLIEIAAARKTNEGQQTKMQLVYAYLTGPDFRHRVTAIVEKFRDMQDDLNKERATMTRLWDKRQKQIDGVIGSTAGMYGDLQGIAGKTLQEIEGLDIKLLETNE
jgi:hypothetical protein